MNELIGKKVEVNGKKGVITRYDKEEDEYFVQISESYFEWYKRKDFTIIEPSTEEVLKIIYDKWGVEYLIKAIGHILTDKEYSNLKGSDSLEKATNLINKWKPKKYLTIENNDITLTNESNPSSIELTDERQGLGIIQVLLDAFATSDTYSATGQLQVDGNDNRSITFDVSTGK